MQQFGDVSVDIGADYVAEVEIHRPPDNFFDVKLIRSLAEAYTALDADAVLPGHRAVLGGQALLRRRRLHRREPGRSPARGGGGQPVPGGGPPVSGRDAGGRRRAGRGRRGRARAGLLGGLPGGGARSPLRRQLRPARLPPRLRARPSPCRPSSATSGRWSCSTRAGAYLARRPSASGCVTGWPRCQRSGCAARSSPSEIAISGPLAIRSIRQTMRGHLADAVAAATDREDAEQIRLRRHRRLQRGNPGHGGTAHSRSSAGR